MSAASRNLVRRLLILALAMALVTSFGAFVHWLTWDRPSGLPAGEGVPIAWLLKPMANLYQVLTAPAWVIAWKEFGVRGGVGPTLVVYSICGVIWYIGLALLFVARDVIIGVGRSVDETPRSPDRRRILVDGVAAVAVLPAGATTAHAVIGAVNDLQVREWTVPIRDLPPGLDGLRVAHLSDLHLGPRIPGSFIAEAVDVALSLKPDLVALTGDYVHAGTHQIDEVARLIAPLTDPKRVPIGAVGVLGNHDWYCNGRGMSAALERVGVRMIDNWRLTLDGASRRFIDGPVRTARHQSDWLCIAGLGDLYHNMVFPTRAFADVPEGTARLVLAHNPDSAEEPSIVRPFGRSSPMRVDLMLSGHTHGGQVRLPIVGTPVVPSKFGDKYAGGLVEGPTCRVLVSRGVGLSILPVRFGVPPEIGLITLVRER